MFLAIIFVLGLWFFSRVSRVYIPHKSHWECCCSVAKSCLTICTPWTTVPQVSLSLSWSLLKLMSIESLMSSNHLILCHPLLLSSILPRSMVFPNELTLCIRWPKFQSFSISPSNEYSGLISFRVDWFYLLAVKGLSRVFSSTAIRKHQFFGTQVFFMLQPSHPYMTTGKTYWCQFSSVAQLCLTLCDPMDCSTPGFPVPHQLPDVSQTHVHWVGDAIQPSHSLSSPSPPSSIFPSIRAFSSESALCIRKPKYWNFSFSVNPSNEYSGLICFRIDWFDLAVQGTLKSLLQHHSSKASVLQCSALFMVQFSHPYMTTGKMSHDFDYTDLCWQSDISAF